MPAQLDVTTYRPSPKAALEFKAFVEQEIMSRMQRDMLQEPQDQNPGACPDSIWDRLARVQEVA